MKNSSRPHVLTLLDYVGGTGGAERLAIEIATRLDKSRFQSSLCASRYASAGTPTPSETAAVERLRESGVQFLPLERSRRSQVAAWRPLASYLRREQVSVLHSHMFGSNLSGALLGRLTRVPVVIAHEHTWSFEGKPLRKLLDREVIARWSSTVIAVSQEDRRKMIDVERIPPEAIRFVPNGIDVNAPGVGRDLRSELGIAEHSPVLGSVGSLRAQKAYDVLIGAVASLRDEHPDLRLLIVGDGEERERLERLVRDFGVEEHVMLLGRRLDVPDVLAILDVAVSSSDYEGSPLAVMEYMDAALPVVATAVGGVPDLVEHGVHGLLVPPRDPNALAAAVGELLRDRERARHMGERGQRRRRTEFDIASTVRNLEDLYEELLASAPRGRR